MIKPPKIVGQFIFWISYPAIYLILRNSHRSRVIIEVDKNVLFVKNWLGDNKLKLPGGGIKSNESSKQSVVREVREETSINLNPDDLEAVFLDFEVKDHGIKYKVDCYYIKLPIIVNTSSKSIEIVESVWLPWPENIDTNRLTKNTIQQLQTWLSSQHLVD